MVSDINIGVSFFSVLYKFVYLKLTASANANKLLSSFFFGNEISVN